MSKKSKIVNFVHYDNKFIPNQILFLNKNLSKFADQIFYIDNAPDSYFKNNPNNVIKFTKFTFIKFFIDSIFADRIILNGLFNRKIIIVFGVFSWSLKKAVWIPWGGDLYRRYKDNFSFKNYIFIFMMNRFMRSLYAISAQNSMEYAVCKNLYKGDFKFIQGAPNIFEFQVGELESHCFKRINGLRNARIQVGNSADPTNNHVEVFHAIKKSALKNYEVVTPLSYGSQDYVRSISNLGSEIFGEKFQPLYEFLSFSKYIQHLSSIDVLIFNHDRQQGFGNMLLALYCGCKVFVRGSTSAFRYLKEEVGCNIYRTEDLLNYCNESVLEMDNSHKDANQKLVKDFFDPDWQAMMWKKTYFE